MDGKFLSYDNPLKSFYFAINYLYMMLIILFLSILVKRKEVILISLFYIGHIMLIVTLVPCLNNSMYSFFAYIGAFLFMPLTIFEISKVIKNKIVKFYR